MPASYRIDLARGLVFSRGWGVLTDGELIGHAEGLRADPRFDPGFQQIVDFRDLHEIRVSTAGVHGLAQINPFRRDARRAVVVPSDLAYGLVRMFEALTNSDANQFRIFRLIEPALEWVGLESSAAWPSETPDAVFDVPR